MKAKKPVRMLTCPRCKGKEFHYDAGTKLATNTYKCLRCNYVMKG